MEALVILDEASYWRPVRCFYGPAVLFHVWSGRRQVALVGLDSGTVFETSPARLLAALTVSDIC